MAGCSVMSIAGQILRIGNVPIGATESIGEVEMKHDIDAVTDYAISLWCDWMSNNFAEIREIWYPSRAPGFSSGGAVTDDGWEDLENECEQRIVQVVQGALNGMTPTMRGAVEHAAGLSTVLRIRNYEEQLQEGRARIYRAVLGAGLGA